MGKTRGVEKKTAALDETRAAIFRVLLSATRTGTAGPASAHAGGDGESGTQGGIHKINVNGFDLLKQLFVHQIGDPIILDHFVVIFWLIQSHAQGGTGSAPLRQKYPDNGFFVSVLEKLLNFLVRLIRHLEHPDGLLLGNFKRRLNYIEIVYI
jgi:hypothetical protein